MRIRRFGEYRSVRKNTALVLIVFLCCCLTGSFYRRDQTGILIKVEPPSTHSHTWNGSTSYKRVIIWNKWDGVVNNKVFTEKDQPNWMNGCPESRCLFLTSKDNPQNADGIIFPMLHFSDLTDIPLPGDRKEGQYYIFQLRESPDRMRKLNLPWYKKGVLDNFFNLTMTYRADSDIWDSYLQGYHMHTIKSAARHPRWFQDKKDILWFVSNCKTASKREEYAKNLENYIKIDKFGRCGTPDPCSLTNNCSSDDLMSKYKFYLAFENSICKEYVTEKLMRALNHDIVPVVLGGANYSSFLPESAFINVETFESPKKLVQYLTTLMKNQTAYERHLEWKYTGQPLWHIPRIGNKKDQRFCKLCEILHRPKHEMIKKRYPDVQEWFFEAEQCRKPYIRF